MEWERRGLASFIVQSVEELGRNYKIQRVGSGRVDCGGSPLAILLRLREKCFYIGKTWYNSPLGQMNALVWRQQSVHVAVQSAPKLLGNGACVNFLDFSSTSQGVSELQSSSVLMKQLEVVPCSPGGSPNTVACEQHLCLIYTLNSPSCWLSLEIDTWFWNSSG